TVHVPMRRALRVVCAVIAAVALSPLPVHAQARAALVVEGVRGSARTQVREPIAAALQSMGYAVVDDGATRSARAFAGQDGPLDEAAAQQLRAAVSASVLVVVALRAAPGGRYFVA